MLPNDANENHWEHRAMRARLSLSLSLSSASSRLQVSVAAPLCFTSLYIRRTRSANWRPLIKRNAKKNHDAVAFERDNGASRVARGNKGSLSWKIANEVANASAGSS